MTDPKDRFGNSGVFKAMVNGARRVKRALSEGDAVLTPEAQEFGNKIAQAFVAGHFADLHAMTTPSLQQRTDRKRFEAGWRDAVRPHGPFTGFAACNAGEIDLAFIPGLEEVPQSQFVAFVEITFSSPKVALGDEDAFVIGAVLLEHGGEVRVGALHAH